MSRWNEQEDTVLRELAKDGLSGAEISRAIPGRSESSIYGRARTLRVSLTSREHQSLRDYLADGGCIVRDEVGGVVGVRWAAATRCGESFATKVCERLVSLGFLRTVDGRENVFCRVAA